MARECRATPVPKKSLETQILEKKQHFLTEKRLVVFSPHAPERRFLGGS